MACFCLRVCLAAVAALVVAIAAPASVQAQKVDQAALCRSDKTDKGIAACTAVLKGRGDRKAKASAHLARGQIYWAQRRLAEAEKDYSETIKLAPNFAALYRDRGQIRYDLGNGAGAMADFTVAIDQDPFNADNHANRGYLKMLHYDFEGAREDFRKGIFWQKEHPRSHYMIGLLHYSTGRYGDAIASIGQARTLGFKGNEAFITKARSHFYLGAFDAAEKEASDGLQGFPAQSDLTEIRARARLAQRMLPEALADAEAVVLAAPRSGRAFATRGAVKLAMKDLDAARADADRALGLDPTLFDAYEIKAETLLAFGDKPSARALYQQSAARTDAKMDYDKTSRNRAAARVVELDRPPPIIVAELGGAELKTRCETRDDPLRMQSCDRLVATAATPDARAAMLILRSKARPFGDQLPDLQLAVEAAPDNLDAVIARASGHLAAKRTELDFAPIERGWADADSAVRRAAPGSDELVDALTVRALAATLLGRYDDAASDQTRLIELDPDQAAFTRAQRALSHLMAGRPAAALEDGRLVEQVDPEILRFTGHATIVLALIETGQTDEALTRLGAWMKADPAMLLVQQSLHARALLARGDDRAALAAAAAAVAANRFNHGALAVRGIASARLGDALTAVADITRVMDEATKVPLKASYDGMTPGFVSDLFLHRGLARVQLRQGNAARADFSETIKLMPDRARAYAERARLAFMADNPAALTDIAMALRIEPADPRWLALAARINHAAGDMAAAERSASQALAARSTEPDLVLLRARTRLALGRFDEAVEDASFRLAAAPADAEALMVRIDARIGAGDLKAALADAEAARAANGGDPRILLALAELKARSGDAPGAIGIFEEAAAKPDASLAANKRLGDLYAGIGSDQLALGYYAKAIETPARKPEDEIAKMAARSARDGLIRKLSAAK